MRLLLTGGRGMVGRNVQEHSAATKYEILAPDRSALDLLDRDAVARYVRDAKVDVVLHAAGTVGGIQANMAEPVRFLVENMSMGMNVITAAFEAGVGRVMNIGSSCMYPRHGQNPLVEESILTGELEPTNEGYALAKITCAKLCDYISRERPDLLYKTIIPSNLYGRHDAFSPHRSHMIPAVIRKIHQAKAAGAAEVDIWGDGTARREFMYAGDLADFIFYALDRYELMPDNMNVGLGYDYSILDYYTIIASVLSYQGSFVFDPSKPVGMAQKLLDVSRMEAFGWTPRVSLADGVGKAFEFYRAEYPND